MVLDNSIIPSSEEHGAAVAWCDKFGQEDAAQVDNFEAVLDADRILGIRKFGTHLSGQLFSEAGFQGGFQVSSYVMVTSVCLHIWVNTSPIHGFYPSCDSVHNHLPLGVV